MIILLKTSDKKKIFKELEGKKTMNDKNSRKEGEGNYSIVTLTLHIKQSDVT